MKKHPGSVRLVSLGLGLIAVVALLIATWNGNLFGSHRYARVVRSPNGSVVRLEGYHFQATNVRYDLPRGFLPKLGKLIPGGLKARFNWLTPAITTIATPRFPGEPVLSAAFSVHESPGSQGSFSAGRIVVSDENGQEFDPAGQQSFSTPYWATEVEAFPRRGKELHLRLMENASVVAEFTIPNPAPGPHPTWTAKPLPISVTDGDVEVSLVRFRTYQPGAAAFTKSGIYPRTQCTFRVREGGHDSTSLRPVSIEISDATGNHWRGWRDSDLDRISEREISFGFLGALWPQEEAWKLRVEFRRISDFSEKDVLRIEHLPIPGPSELLQPQRRSEAGGATVQVAALIGAKVPWSQINRMNADRQPGCMTVLITGQILSRNRRLNIVGATDDQGRELKLQGEAREPGRLPGQNPDLLPYSFNFKSADGARELNLVLGISRSRYLDFLAKPEQVKDSESQAANEARSDVGEAGH